MEHNPEQTPVPAEAPVAVDAVVTVVAVPEPAPVEARAPAPAPAAEPAPEAPAPNQPVSGKGRREDLPVVGQTNAPFGIGNMNTPVDPESIITLGPGENKNVEILYSYTTPPVPLSKRTDLNNTVELLPFLAERGDDVDDRIRTYASRKAIQLTKLGQQWNSGIVQAASSTAFIDGRFESSFKREGAEFKQILKTEHGIVGYKAPKPMENGVGAPLTGERAMHRVRSILGLAGQISVPMYHSGFWITLEAPPDSDVIELQRRIQEEKIQLGRETYGLVFSNEQSYINSYLLDFCLEHIHSHTVRIDNIQELKKLIKIQDLNILFWGMACLIWPRGFDYVRSLMTKTGIENTEVISAKISVGKLMWVDNASFDDKQRAHFYRTERNQMTVESVQAYQDTFVPSMSQGRLVTIKDGLQILINSTNAANYIADGSAWIAGIIQTVDSTFTQATPDAESRNRMIDTHARASYLRNYGAWVKAIVIDEQENTNREDIADTLTLLSADPELSEKIVKEITKFIDESTRALIAIPETDGTSADLRLFPNLIPIDVLNTFFTLLEQRVDIIANR